MMRRRSRRRSPCSGQDMRDRAVVGDVDRRVASWVSVRGEAVDEAAKPGPLRTLMQTHDELVRIRPGGDASLAVWLAYYQRSVALYEQIAKIDPFHEQEALYWAQRERHRAEEIATRIRAQRSRT